MTRASFTTTLTPAESLSAIYLDFEGRTDKPPILLGACYAEGRRQPDQGRIVLRHDVVDAAHGHLAGAMTWTWPDRLYRYDTADRTLRASLADLVGRAHRQGRLIVSWSQHEREVIEQAGLGRTITNEFLACYRDAKATAKRWARLSHPEVDLRSSEGRATTHQLAKYFELTGFEVPEEFGPARTGKNLARVEHGLARGGFDEMTPRQRQAWEEVLGHNLYDCFGLRRVALVAAHDVASMGAAA